MCDRAVDRTDPLLGEIGVPVAAARGAAIRQRLLELPAPVVADALGYHDKTTSRLLKETGGTWSRYAAGDHTRSPAGWGFLGELVEVEYGSPPAPRPEIGAP